MGASASTTDQTRSRISFSTRLVAALAFVIPAIGGALGAFLLMNVFSEMRKAETAGIAAVMGGMKQASLPVLISFYLAAVVALIVIIILVIRMFVQTKTASPPVWFFLIGGLLAFVPALCFWKAQMIVIDVLSPGSSIGSAGISGVASDISRWLLMSIVAAPIVFVVVLVISVLPLSSSGGKKWGSLVVTFLAGACLVATAVGVPFFIGEPKRKNETVQLPVAKFADMDYNADKTTSMVITMTADNKLTQRQSRDTGDKVERTEVAITPDALPQAIKTGLEGKTPENRVVYFKCDPGATYDNVLKVFQAIRNAEIEKVALVVAGEKSAEDQYQLAPLNFRLNLPPLPSKAPPVKPNPLILVAALAQDGKLTLNNEDNGTISDTRSLNNKLRDIFKERENNGVFREDTNEVQKTVSIKAAGAAKYGDVIKLIDAVKAAGADPIAILFDDEVRMAPRLP
ncbi:MAG: biopolymer transporter ExbD [Acidobacteria bacterium]|nr:biopolymer transporter ExbD [Acidobacteriota bacterium]